MVRFKDKPCTCCSCCDCLGWLTTTFLGRPRGRPVPDVGSGPAFFFPGTLLSVWLARSTSHKHNQKHMSAQCRHIMRRPSMNVFQTLIFTAWSELPQIDKENAACRQHSQRAKEQKLPVKSKHKTHPNLMKQQLKRWYSKKWSQYSAFLHQNAR